MIVTLHALAAGQRYFARYLPIIGMAALLGSGPAMAKDKFVALGTGSPNGTYFPVGKGICELVNDRRLEHGVRCIAYNTGGSVYNIQAVMSGELEMGITRSDLAFQAHDGLNAFKAIGPNPEIRAVTTLYAMPIAVLVKKDAEIEKFADLEGKRINIGNKGSGKRSVAELIMNIMGWQRGDFSAVLELSTKKMGKAFCDGNVDILIEGLGNPSKFYEQMVKDCGGKFIAVPKEVVAKIKKKFPYFASLSIPGKIYSGTPDPVGTFGFKATLVTKREVHGDTVYDIVSSIFSKFKKFQEKHPSLSLAVPKQMVNEGIFIPIHEGALRYYMEKGYIKQPPKKAEKTAKAGKATDKSDVKNKPDEKPAATTKAKGN